jgi:hypothetical protein
VATAQTPNLSLVGDVYPTDVDEGQGVTIEITVANNDNKDYDNLKVQIFIFKSTTSANPQYTEDILLPALESIDVIYTWVSKGGGDFTVLVKVIDDQGLPIIEEELSHRITVKKDVPPPTNPLFMEIAGIPLIVFIILIVVVVVIVAVVAVKKKKKKGTTVEITGEGVEVTGRVAWGKMPENYYTERRDRLAKLRPVGLTRAGRTILGSSQTGGRVDATSLQGPDEETEALPEGPKICSRCGYEMPSDWKSCMRCDASNVIRETKALMKEVNALGVSLGHAETVIRQADASFEAENFTEAEMFAFDAKTKISEEKRKFEAKKKAEEEETAKIEAETHTQPVPEGPKGPENCPGCGMGMQADWSSCPVCNMTVEDMLKAEEEGDGGQDTGQTGPQVEEQPVVPQVPICEICGNEKGSQDAPCKHCNTGKAISNAERKVKDLRIAVSSITISSELQLDINEAVDLMQDAKGAFFDKDYNTAVGLAGETIDLVEEIMARLGTAPPPAPEPEPTPGPEPQPVPEPTPTPAATPGKCPKCGMSVKPSWDLCPMCETPLPKTGEGPRPAVQPSTCPSCGKSVKPHWSMCPFCEGQLK